MGERWSIYVCEGCDWMSDSDDTDPNCSCDRDKWGDDPPEVRPVEVVPASALKRCEEERDAKHEWALGLLARAVDAEAKCERLEERITEASELLELAKDPDEGISPENVQNVLLSTPKTEGERWWGRVEKIEDLPPDPIGRDVRGYEK